MAEITRRRFQRKRGKVRCRACIKRRADHSHHVVYERELRNRGLPSHDDRNLMALCSDCHYAHHNPGVRIEAKLPLILLTDENIAYAFEVLGDYAYDYLKARYRGHDDRLEARLAA